jgi:hypothetical protein
MQAVRLALALIAGVLAVGAGVLVLSGGDDGHPRVNRLAPPTMLSQPQIQALRCRDWQRLGPASRAQALAGLRSFLGGEVIGRGASGRGSTLRDAQAQRLFDGYCRLRFAGEFSLYKLYGQGAGFAGRP